MDVLLVVILVCAVLAALVLLVYNGLVRARNLVANSWGLVDAELQRRHDLVPNLVECVKGYAVYERDVLDAVTARRAAAVAASPTPEARESREHQLVDGVRQLFGVAENYPDLQASHSYRELQRALIDTEDRITVARRVYNANVRDFNTRVQSFPGMIFARGPRFAEASFFDAGETLRNAAPPSIT